MATLSTFLTIRIFSSEKEIERNKHDRLGQSLSCCFVSVIPFSEEVVKHKTRTADGLVH
jgi:hypothetical protein